MAESCATQLTVGPDDQLFVPHRKRLRHAYVTSEEGAREFRIDYGLKEISFDEERFFAFGEQLVALKSFIASSATQWGPGYSWDELLPMLEALLNEGILKRGDAENESRDGGLVPSPLPASRCPVARFWNTSECEGITRDLGKRAVELGHLEAFVPVYRVAHAAIDEDDRQVGEANVYPPSLRLDRATEWRICQYPGSRYRDDSPMNVTALKAMIKHWKPMMVTMLRVRAELQQRLGLTSETSETSKTSEPWALGDLHTLSAVVLALPAYVLQKHGGTAPQKPLHPVLSSLFRITDGIRMTAYEMFFMMEEKPRRPDEPMTAAMIYEYAEQHGVFISDTGVCAGPKPLIDEFLATAVDGVPISGTEDVVLSGDVELVLGELPQAIDYGLHGLQVWALTSATWLAMSEAYEAILDVLRPMRSDLGEPGERFVAALQADWEKLRRVQISTDYEREVHRVAYQDAYERSHRAVRSPVGNASFSAVVKPVAESAQHQEAAHELRRALRARLTVPEIGGEHILDKLVDPIVRYLRVEQAIVGAVTELQAEINGIVQRPRPNRPISGRDFLLFYTLNGSVFPYLFHVLESELDIQIVSDARSFTISDRHAS